MLSDAATMIAAGVQWGTRGTIPLIWAMPPETIRETAHVLEGIGDPGARFAAYTKLAGNWKERDELAARAWIESLPLPAGQKDILLKAEKAPWPPPRP